MRALPVLVLISLLAAGRAGHALESRWWSLGGGAELTRHADTDPQMFRGAEGWTRSIYGSAGAGSRWLVAAGLTDQRVWQQSWSYRGIKRSLWLVRAVTPALGVEALGVSLTSRVRWPLDEGVLQNEEHGWIAGGGVNWCPAPFAANPLVINARMSRLSPAAPGAGAGRPMAGELNLNRRSTKGIQRLGLLLSRAEGETRVAGLIRASTSIGGLGAHASALLGHQDHWFDVERLVIHDGNQEMRASLGAGLSWRAWQALSLEGSVGWERVTGSESRWLFLGMKWTRQVWAATE